MDIKNYIKQEYGNILTVKEISEIFKFNRQSVYRMIKKGNLKATKINGATRIYIEDLISLISNETKPSLKRGRPKKKPAKNPNGGNNNG